MIRITRNEINRIEEKMSKYDFKDKDLYEDIKSNKITLNEFIIFMDLTRYDEYVGKLNYVIIDDKINE